MGRVWAHAFWRGGPIGTQDGRDAAPLYALSQGVRERVYVPVMALVALIVVIGIYPSPVFSVSQSGAETLLKPDRYFEAVFGPVAEQNKEREQSESAKGHNVTEAADGETSISSEGAH